MAGASLSTSPQEPSLSFQSSPLLRCMLPASAPAAAISLSRTGGIVCFLVVGKVSRGRWGWRFTIVVLVVMVVVVVRCRGDDDAPST